MEDGKLQSEVARFREQQALQEEAAWRSLQGAALVASHRFITARMEQMWTDFQCLLPIVGQAEAHRLAFGECCCQRPRHTGSPGLHRRNNIRTNRYKEMKTC